MTVVLENIASTDKLPINLRKNNNWFQTFFKNTPDATFIIDMSSRILSVNEKASRLLGYSENELIDVGFDGLYGNQYKNTVPSIISIVEERGNLRCKDSIRNKEGYLIPVESDFIIVQNDIQKVIIVIVRDISEQKNLEDELKAACTVLKRGVFERTSKLEKLNREFQGEIETRRSIQSELEISKSIIPQSSDAIIVTDQDGNVVQWLAKSEQIFGYSAEEMDGQKVSVLYDPSVIDRIFLDINKGIVDLGGFVGNIPCVKKDGSSFVVEASIRLVAAENGKYIYYAGNYRDITEKRKLEAVISDLEAKYRELINIKQDFVIRVDPEGKFTFVNDIYCLKFMKNRTDLIQKENIFSEDNGFINSNNTNGCNKSSGENSNTRLRIPLLLEQYANTVEGWRWIVWINSPVRDANGNIVEFECVGHDVTMYKKTEEKMQVYRKRLQSLAFEMSIVEERQRRNIAQVLHDSIGQSLALCTMQLGSLSASRCSREIKDKVRLIHDTIKSVIKETRSLTLELNPPALYEKGLGRAIKRLIEKISNEHNLRIEYYEHGEKIQLEGDILGLLFQATRELFVNIMKHAQANTVQVHLRYLEEQIQIEVKDDGKGFDKNYTLSNTDKTNSFGLFSISERIQYLGGTVKINSKPGKGTEITLCLPYKLDISHNVWA